MPTWLPPGPYKTLQSPSNLAIPYYIIRFDDDGRCESPQTRSDLVNRLTANAYTDVFLFSHGWNNDWTAATRRYESFMNGYMAMVASRGLKHRDGFKPILVGIFWPSTAFVFGEDEEGPRMAGGDRDSEVGAEGDVIADLARSIPAASRDRFYELIGKEWTTPEEARELVVISAPLYASNDDETVPPATTADELLRNWAEWQPKPADSDIEFDLDHVATSPAASSDGPQAAFLKLPDKFSPRSWIRGATVWKMKDRAGKVGAHGVGPLLRDLASAPHAPRVHLVGHSYGAKVMLSALCSSDDMPTVESALLLQPAISHLCFADDVEGRPGGYRPALDRVRKPIFTTFSRNDDPLRNWFHRALRRDKDLAEVQIAGADNPPSPFAALGGYGPRRCGELIQDIHDPGLAYDLSLPGRVHGIHGTRTIAGHGDISNPSTWWALYCLASV